MRHGKTLLLRGWILVAVLLMSLYFVGTSGFAKGEREGPRSDIITIDSLKVFGYLERPTVTFLHDLHTETLEKMGKDCSACHFPAEKNIKIPGTFNEAVKGIDRMSPKFKRLKDTAREEVMDVYHRFCVECHTDLTEKGEKTGPVSCGGCHKEGEVTSNRQPMGFDQALHYRHVKANRKEGAEEPEKNCELCHHKYDPEKKELYYAKGKEESCRYCHEEKTEENRVSMRLASHIGCVDCHRKTLAKKEKTGPINCAGCHSPEAQAKIEKPEEVPRMERNQPDMTLVKLTADRELATEDELKNRMAMVPYDHKAHEQYNDTCRVCHHASLDSCSKCHTLTGDKDGDYIRLEGAMHRPGNRKSCVGCHQAEQAKDNCAGCHAFIEGNQAQTASDSCKSCHMDPLPGEDGEIRAIDLTQMSDELSAKMAQALLESRKPVKTTYAKEDIPEKVSIRVLSDRYEPAEFPHRKIVNTLVKTIEGSKLAQYFHTDKGTVCQGCHHNSPVSKKPPKCASCHDKERIQNVSAKKLFVPRLIGAYHQQCISCHQEMKLEKPSECADCHKEKKNS